MTDPERRQLRRDLGRTMATAVVVGNVIGSGIFLKPGVIAAEGGNFGLIMGVWLFGGFLCLLGALCFAELATMFPHAGGLYVYLREAYGRPVGFLFGWTDFIVARPCSIGALSMAFIGSFSLSLNWHPGLLAQLALVALLIGGMTGVNIVGVIWGGRLQLATTAIKVVFLAGVALLPWCLSPLQGWQIDAANYASTVTPRTVTLSTQLGAVLLAIMWAYNGWHVVAPLSEEIKEPQRNIPFALFAGIGLLTLLYVSANVAYHGVLSMQEMSDAGQNAAEMMLLRLAGPIGQRAMSLVIMCSTFGAINTNILQAPRITFAMARDGLFANSLHRVHARFGTPVIAILTTSVSAFLFVGVIALAKLAVDPVSASTVSETINMGLGARIVHSLRTDSLFDLLTNFVIFSEGIFYMLAVMALFILRRRMPNAERPYRCWGYPVVPIAFLLVYAWFMFQVYSSNPLESRAGIALVAVGLPVYGWYRLRGK